MPGPKKRKPNRPTLIGREGVDYVRCQICGDRRRVISGRHLSKHEIDRQTYVTKFQLSPDELIAKHVRRRVRSRSGYQPFGKRDWIVTIKRYRGKGTIFAGTLKKKFPFIYRLGVLLFGDWDTALRAAGFDPNSIPIGRHSKFVGLREGKNPREAVSRDRKVEKTFLELSTRKSKGRRDLH